LIAAVNGPALAGGLELMLACDIAISVPHAVFGLPEPRIGLVAGAGGALRLPHRLPRAAAMQMLLTGDAIDAQAALRLGLITTIVEGLELAAEAARIAARIAANSPASIKATIAVSEILGGAEAEAAWARNDAILYALMATHDAAEGPAAFLAKRAPDWAPPGATELEMAPSNSEREIAAETEFSVRLGARRLFVKDWTPYVRAEGPDAPILLFHDSLGCVDLWRSFPGKLANATGRRVIAYDRLGLRKIGCPRRLHRI